MGTPGNIPRRAPRRRRMLNSQALDGLAERDRFLPTKGYGGPLAPLCWAESRRFESAQLFPGRAATHFLAVRTQTAVQSCPNPQPRIIPALRLAPGRVTLERVGVTRPGTGGPINHQPSLKLHPPLKLRTTGRLASLHPLVGKKRSRSTRPSSAQCLPIYYNFSDGCSAKHSHD